MSLNSHNADIVILGGGPAGASAAITAAEAGLDVILLEQKAFPRPAPGESAHPGVQALFRQLGIENEVLDANFLRHPGHIVRTDAEEKYIPFGTDESGTWLGFQLWRPTFDRILLERTRAAGAMVIQPGKARELIYDKNQIVGVECTLGKIRARYVIDATGRQRTLARWLNLDCLSNGPTRRAYYGYAIGSCSTCGEIPVLTSDERGWTWIARVQPGTFAWTRLNFDSSRPPSNWLPAEISQLTPLGAARGADVTWEIVQKPAGRGYFLTGDAAAVLDPSSGHGILKALMSGILAGHLASKVLHRATSESAAATHFTTWIHEWFRRDVDELNSRYDIFPLQNG